MTHAADQPAIPIAPQAIGVANKPWGIWTTIAWGAVAFGALWLVSATHLPLPRPLSVFLGWALALAVVVVAVLVRRCAIVPYLAWHAPRPAAVILALAAALGYIICWTGFVYFMTGGAFTGVDIQAYQQHVTAGGSPSAYAWAQFKQWYPTSTYDPIVEETLFRGFLWRGFAASRLGNFGAWLLTSALFVAAHIGHYDPTALIPIGITGLILGLVRWRTGSTTAGMITHSLVNLWNDMGALVVVAIGLAP